MPAEPPSGCASAWADSLAFGWQEDDGRGTEIAAALLAREVVEAPDGTLADAETGEVIDPAAATTPIPDAGEMPQRLAYPPSLVGALIAGPTESGTHLYVVGWAGRASQVILASSLSIYGVLTAEEFYGAL